MHHWIEVQVWGQCPLRQEPEFDRRVAESMRDRLPYSFLPMRNAQISVRGKAEIMHHLAQTQGVGNLQTNARRYLQGHCCSSFIKRKRRVQSEVAGDSYGCGTKPPFSLIFQPDGRTNNTAPSGLPLIRLTCSLWPSLQVATNANAFFVSLWLVQVECESKG